MLFLIALKLYSTACHSDSVNRGTSAVKNVCKPVQLVVYGPGYQDEEQKVEKDTSIYICQGSSEPPD